MNRRPAFSLLELVLALALSLVVIGLIISSIRLYMIQLERRRVEIEQQHISRGVISMISLDLRSAIQYKAQDYSPLEDLVQSQTLAGISSLPAGADEEDIDAEQLEQDITNSIASGGGAGTQAGQGDQADSEGDEEELEDEEEEETGRPTFVGTSRFIRFDISRLPRQDEINPLIVNQGSGPRLPSDIKTVTYFFSSQPPVEQVGFDAEFGRQGGLFRRQVDRAVESHRNGDQDIEIVVVPDEFSELVSPEVSDLRFRFWDGENWHADWDSVEMMGFPSAVEIVVVIDPERIVTERVEISDIERLEVQILRQVVHLPVAEIIEEEYEQTQGSSGTGEER